MTNPLKSDPFNNYKPSRGGMTPAERKTTMKNTRITLKRIDEINHIGCKLMEKLASEGNPDYKEILKMMSIINDIEKDIRG